MYPASKRVVIAFLSGGALVGIDVLIGHRERPDPVSPAKIEQTIEKSTWAEYIKGMEFENRHPPDYEQAEKHLRVAVEHGLANAQTELGQMYVIRGLAADGLEKAHWLRAAAELGDSSGALYLGEMYFHGDGVGKNYHEAFKWLQLSAEKGEFNSQMYLGTMYGRGDFGVPRDDVQAYMWFNLAAAQEGNATDLAEQRRETVGSHMAPDQIAEAQRLAREWRPKTGKAARVEAK